MAKKDRRRRSTPRVFDKTNPPRESLVGQKFGLLKVVDWAGKSDVNVSTKRQRIANFWACECVCKDPEYNPVIVEARCLRNGNTSSCGCKRRKHKMTGTRTYHVWVGMIGRCTNPANEDYHNYGGRGISVCDRWRNSFENFYSDMGDPPDDSYTLDRRNNDAGYSPENCRWATRKQQNRNRRDNRFVTWDRETKIIAEWGEDPRLVDLGITALYLATRLNNGWSVERAMTTPAVMGKPITFQGQTLTMIGWSERLGASKGNNIVSKRLRAGWSIEDALTVLIGANRDCLRQPTEFSG